MPQRDYITITKKEYAAQSPDNTKINNDDKMLDKIIENLDYKAKKKMVIKRSNESN